MAEDAWNTRDPARVALAYTVDKPVAQPRRVLRGPPGDHAFLERKWTRARTGTG